MRCAVCTLFEGDFHYGAGVLVNSLYHHGYRGVVWAGYRGPLPRWAASSSEGPGYHELPVADGCVIRFVPVASQYHLTNYKPDFMLDVWAKHSPDSEALFFFDSDIVNKCSWSFYEEWVTRGITLCEDRYPYMPLDHPWRLAWREFAQGAGYQCQRLLTQVFNGGFLGLKRSEESFLLRWREVQEACDAAGYFGLRSFYLIFEQDGRIRPTKERTHPYIAHDQDALNVAVMVTTNPLSTVGPEGMDFGKPGFLMSHPAGGDIVKPWRKRMIRAALGGVPPTPADKLFWLRTQTPIQVFPPQQVLWRRITLRCAAAIGRFIRRAPASSA